MIWLRLLGISRPVWQLAIIGIYSLHATTALQRANIALAGAVFVTTNALLATFLGDARWSEVRRSVLIGEAVLTAATSVLLIAEWPMGPASLLFLPTLVTYAWLRDRDTVQWLIGLASMVAWMVSAVASRVYVQRAGASGDSAADALLLALYLSIVLLGASLAFLLQVQKRESRRSYEAMHHIEEQAALLTRVNERVNEYANQVYDLATAEERNRIAGEIHDTVGHRLTALLVQLQISRRAARDGRADEALTSLEVCEALTRETLDEVRYSVRRIRRSSDLEGVDLLRRLTAEYASLTGMDVQTEIAPEVAALVPAHVITVLYRMLEEGLTNAQRHGRATQVRVTISRVNLNLMLEVADNGKGVSHTTFGFGLSTIHHRVCQLGGEVKVASRPGQGFTLTIQLPIWEGEPA